MSTFFLVCLVTCVTVCVTPSLASGFGINLIKVQEDDPSQVICTIALLRKYFHSGEALSGSLLSVSITSASARVQRDLLNAIHTNTEAWSVVVKNAREPMPPNAPTQILHEKPQAYFVVLENLETEDMEEIFEVWKTNVNWNPLAQFVVYLASVEETDDEITELMIEILLNFMNKKIYNVNIIGQNEADGFYYGKTVFPYHPDNNCGNRVITIKTLDICDYQYSAKDGEGDYEENLETENYFEQRLNVGDYSQENTFATYNDNKDGERDEGTDGGKPKTGDNETVEGNEKGMVENGEDGLSKADDKQNGISNEEDGIKVGSVERSEYDNKEESEDAKEDDREDDKQNGSEDRIRNDNKEATYNEGIVAGDINKTDQEVGKAYDEQLKDSNEKGQHSFEIVRENEIVEHDDSFHSVNNKDKEFNSALEQEKRRHQKATVDIKVKEGVRPLVTENVFKLAKDIDTEDDELHSISIEDELNEDVVGNFDMTKRYKREAQSRHHKKFEMQLAKYTEHRQYRRSIPKLHLEELFPALFLDKFPKDLSGCPLIAAYRSWEPYIFNEATDDENFNEDFETNAAETDENSEANAYDEHNAENVADNTQGAQAVHGTGGKTTAVQLSGIEYKMVQTIGERLHINIVLQVENRNLYHLFQLLIDGDIEMIVGGIDEDPSISQFVSSTVPYHQDDLTWCVAKARRKHKLFNFLASFQPGVWLLMLVFIVIAAFHVVLITRLLQTRLWYLQDYVTITMRVLGLILSQSVKLQHLPSALRVNLTSVFFMSFMFINVYQSFLVSTLTNPKSTSQISHLKEIYLNRMSIMGSVENVRHLNKEGEIFKYVRQKFEMCYNIEECLRRAAHDEHLAVTVSRQHSFYNPRIPRDQLYCFDRDENMYVYLVTMLLPKKFHLLHKINPVIQHVIESGHMEKWARDLDMKRKIQEGIRRAREEQFKNLSLAQVIGTFVFGGVLILNALLVFVLEHWVYWMVVKRKTRLKPVRYLHRKFGHL